jgi:hypothetical protein
MSDLFERSLRVVRYEVIAHKSGLGLLVIDYLPPDADIQRLSEAQARRFTKTVRFAVTAKIASKLGEMLGELGSGLTEARRHTN